MVITLKTKSGVDLVSKPANGDERLLNKCPVCGTSEIDVSLMSGKDYITKNITPAQLIPGGVKDKVLREVLCPKCGKPYWRDD